MQNIVNEYDYLIHLVRCAIHNLQPQELPEGLKFERVFEYGKYHQVANIAFYSLEKVQKKPDSALYSQWQAYRDQTVMCDITQSYAAQEIRQALQDRGIRWVEVQGTKIKPLYPQPDFRTMSDMDFIIDEENIPKAKELLEDLGYVCETVYQVELNGDRPPNTYVEMHTEYFLEDCPYRPILNSPFDHVDEQGESLPNVFYLYNILHIAKHYFFSGCGIRRVLDVYYLNQAYAQSAQDPEVKKILEQAELTEFVAEFDRLAQVWFGLEEQAFPRSKMVCFILNAGIHGSFYNEQQKFVETTFHNTGRFARFKYYLTRLIGTREDLITRYPVLQKNKILYPFCWLHRIFCILTPKRYKRIRQEMQIVKKMENDKK